MMPMRMRRKARRCEKVENLYRTATVQKILPPEPIRSALGDSAGSGSGADTIERRTPLGENVEC